MAIRFNANEVFEMAERMEQNAAAYYHTAAETVNYPGGRQLFLDLAAWEEKHEKIFAGLHEQLNEDAREETTFDPYDETSQYLQALADSSVYDTSKSPLENLGRKPSFEDILQFAIGKENEAINFYTGIKQMVPKSFGETDVETIIREEMKHVVILNGWLSKAKTD